jgi:hypothetical protein
MNQALYAHMNNKRKKKKKKRKTEPKTALKLSPHTFLSHLKIDCK